MGLDQPSNQPAPEVNDPRSGGWRPGAHWAKNSDEWLERRIARKRTKREAIQAEIDELPVHKRPSIQEMGRRSEAMPHPFRAMPPDEAGRLGERVSPYNLEGAFWQQGRTLGPLVAREVIAKSADPSPLHRHPRESGDPASSLSTRVKRDPRLRGDDVNGGADIEFPSSPPAGTGSAW
jgi:hypothetical protein